MIEIRQKNTGKVLLRVDADSLRHANLSGAHLRGADFTKADLTGIDLSRANLAKAEFTEAILDSANLSNAKLIGAELSVTRLHSTNFTDADLYGARLIGSDCTMTNFTNVRLKFANLFLTKFWATDFTNADFTGMICMNASFARCPLLAKAKGLENIDHRGIISVDIETLRTCIGDLPIRFLRYSGCTQEEIETFRALYGNGIQFYSCFLSSAEADLPFVTRLHNDLQANGVICWHYKEDMRGGLDWKPQINDAIKFHDKLVLVCSRRSVYRENVVHEIIQAIDSERETGNQKLFPIRLDNHIFSDAMMEEAREMVASRVWRENWIVHIKRKHVPNFSTWESHADYEKEFKNLLRDLKQPAK